MSVGSAAYRVGRLETVDGDFVGVVDTSHSYGKVAPLVTRTAPYQRHVDDTATVLGRPIQVRPGQQRTISLTYANPAPERPLRVLRQRGYPPAITARP